MPAATVTSKGQITVPADIRADLRLVPGSRLNFEKLPDGRWVVQRKTRDIGELYGIIEYDGPPVSLEEMDEAIAEGAARGL